MNIVNLNYLYAAIAEIKVVSLGETISKMVDSYEIKLN